jgi:hypothetical protein
VGAGAATVVALTPRFPEYAFCRFSKLEIVALAPQIRFTLQRKLQDDRQRCAKGGYRTHR